MEKHLLDEQIEIETKEKLLKKAKLLLVNVRKEIDNRNSWIRAREEQKNMLSDIQAEVYKAYDDADEAALESLTKKYQAVLEMRTGSGKKYPKDQFDHYCDEEI